MSEEVISGKENILSFFHEQDIIYLKRSRIQWKPLLKKKLDKSPYYKINIDEFRELDLKYGALIEQSHIASVYIKKISDKIGYGLFSSEKIKKGDFIGEYTGVIDISEEITEEYDDGSFETDFSWDYPDETGHTTLEINGRLE